MPNGGPANDEDGLPLSTPTTAAAMTGGADANADADADAAPSPGAPRRRRCCPASAQTPLNVALLGLGWALAASGLFVQVSTTSLLVNALRPGTPLATLPIALFFLAAASTLVPLSLLARGRAGERRAPVFLGATLVACGGAALQLGAAYVASANTTAAAPLALLSLGAALQGPSFATANNYRFAASEFVERPALRPRALSFVVAAALLAAALGPEAARRTVSSIAAAPYAGAYAYLMGLYAAQLLALCLVDWALLRERQGKDAALGQEAARRAREEARPLAVAAEEGGGAVKPATAAIPTQQQHQQQQQPQQHQHQQQPPTPYRALLLTPDFLTAALTCAGAFASMAALMALTPLRVVGLGLGADVASHTVVAHIAAMYLPALMMGDAVRLAGVAPVMAGGFAILLAGTLSFLAAAPSASASASTSAFYAGMVLIGVGWSGAYVAASALAASCYASEPPERRFPVQAATDSCVLLLSGLAMGSATPLLRAPGFGWGGILALYASVNGALMALAAGWGGRRWLRLRRREGG